MLALLLSGLLHTAPAALPRAYTWVTRVLAGRSAEPEVNVTLGNKATFRSPEEIQRARRELVTRALSDRAAGRLRLGRFLLAADALDAEEERAELDLAEAQKRYDTLCAKLERELGRDPSVVVASGRAFSDLAYSSAVHRLSDLVLTGVGACGPAAQIRGACLYDLRRRHGLALRYWGGVNTQGATHVTATWREDAVTFDLVTAAPVHAGGVSLPPDRLIEAYARAHGILPPPAHGERPRVDEAAVASFAYPTNDDVFEADAPLFAKRASGAASTPDGAGTRARAAPVEMLSDDTLDALPPSHVQGSMAGAPKLVRCPLRPQSLHHARVDLTTPSGTSQVELVRVPSDAALSVIAQVVARYERDAPRAKKLDRLTTHSCLALAYDFAATRFAAAGRQVIAREAARRATRQLKAARELLDEIRRSNPGYARDLDTQADHWTLIAFDEGAKTLLSMEMHPDEESEPRIELFADRMLRRYALLLFDATREQLVRAAPELTLNHRVTLVGMVVTLLRTHPEIEPTANSWLARAVEAYERMLDAMVAGDLAFVSEDYAKRQIELLRALGATEEQLDTQRKATEILKQRRRPSKRRRRP